jgi:hypothetical protein
MSDEVIKYENYIQQLEGQMQDLEQKNIEIGRMQKVFANQQESNLIVYQLSMQEELDNMYHLLRGDLIKEDEKGNKYYEECPEEEKPFNDFGIQRIMNMISFYLHKGIILSYWLEPEDFYPAIRLAIEDMSDYITDNFLQMGMDTEDKVKMYPIIINALKDNIHSSFRRALFGRELNSLRSARLVSQKSDEGMTNINPMNNQSNKKSWLKPWTWGG